MTSLLYRQGRWEVVEPPILNCWSTRVKERCVKVMKIRTYRMCISLMWFYVLPCVTHWWNYELGLNNSHAKHIWSHRQHPVTKQEKPASRVTRIMNFANGQGTISSVSEESGLVSMRFFSASKSPSSLWDPSWIQEFMVVDCILAWKDTVHGYTHLKI